VSVLSLSSCRFAFHALIGLRSLRLNITEFCSFNSSIVPRARGSKKDESFDATTDSMTDGNEDEQFKKISERFRGTKIDELEQEKRIADEK